MASLGHNSAGEILKYDDKTSFYRAVKKMKMADGDKNGLIGRFPTTSLLFSDILADYTEWSTYYKNHVRDARTMFPAFQVILYQPQYSCNPPPVVILFLSFLQVRGPDLGYTTNHSLPRSPATSTTAPTSPAW